MSFDYNILEQKVLAQWREGGKLKKLLATDALKLKNSESKKFIFWEGPPTANGAPGLHHLLARVFKDAVLRFWNMSGYAIPRIAGWDCHGLPVELQVEKQLGLSGKKDIENLKTTSAESIAYFNDECQKTVWGYLEKWEEVTTRMGYWIDQEHPYRTLDNSYIESVWWVLFRAWSAGYLVAKKKIVPHCPRCVSTLSSHELAQGYRENTPDPSAYFILPLAEKPEEALLVWTTTPWTLPANVAVAINSEATYVKTKLRVEPGGVKYVWLAKDLASSLSKYVGEIIEEKFGSELVGLKYHPLFNIHNSEFIIPYQIVSADFVGLAEGTGLVHIAPMYGEDDNILGEKMGWTAIESVNLNGIILEGLPGAGKFMKDGDKDILEDLKTRGLLVSEIDDTIRHTYPFCWRCETSLMYVAKDSWFIKMSEEKIKNIMIEKNQKIVWEPSHIRDGRFGEWLQGARNWAISRERYWGTPLPLWVSEAGEVRFFNISEKEIKESKNLDELYARGLAWLKMEMKKNNQLENWHRPYIDEISFDGFKRVPFVCDVWLDSGCMPYAQSGFTGAGEIFYPADYIAEAVDQTRGWFYTLLAVASLLEASGVKLSDEPPFKSVICLGHINDARGQKMSKSKGNVMEPMAIMEKYGADTVRLALVSMNPAGEPKNFDEKFLQTTQRQSLSLLLNVMQFFEAYSKIVKSKIQNSESKTNLLDTWISALSKKYLHEWHNFMRKNKLTESARATMSFVDEASTWYLRLSRERFKGAEAVNALGSLREVIKTAVIMLAPFCPFTADDLWPRLGESKQLFIEQVLLEEFENLNADEEKALVEMALARSIVEKGRKLRESHGLKIRQPLAKFTVKSGSLSEEYFGLIAGELNVLKVEYGEAETFDFELTKELKKMGLAREFKRTLGDWRRGQKLAVGEVVVVSVWCEEGEINNTMKELAESLGQDTWLNISIEPNSGEAIEFENSKIYITKK